METGFRSANHASFWGSCLARPQHPPPNPPGPRMSRPSCITAAPKCHRAGEVAPMSFTSYKEVRPWAKAIRERVLFARCHPGSPTRTREFPQRPAAVRQGHRHDQSAWVDAGAPEGDPKHTPAVAAVRGGMEHRQARPDLRYRHDFDVPARRRGAVQVLPRPRATSPKTSGSKRPNSPRQARAGASRDRVHSGTGRAQSGHRR